MASQITKDFHMKSKLRELADGGSPNPSALGSGGATRTAGLLAGRGRQIDAAVDAAVAAPAQAPASAPQQAPQAPKKSGLRALFGLADGGSYLDEGFNANRYQQSQLKDGGRVKGPGGRTDDKVGPVMLSDEEYVLPGDTADAIGREKLDAIRLATHDFKSDNKESSLRSKVTGLADGGTWSVDSSGTVRKPNAFGDAASGYQQPKLPPPTPNTAVVPSTMSPGGPRTINMGMVEDVTPRLAQIANNPTAAKAAGAVGAAEAAGVGAGAAAAATRAEQLGRVAGNAARVGLRVGGGLAATAPIAGFGDYKADTGGVDTSAGGTLGYLAKGEFGNAGTSLSGGLGEALADSGRGVAKTADWAAGLVGAKPDLTGSYDKMVADKLGGYLSLHAPATNEQTGVSTPAAPTATEAASSALRSDQGAELPVQPGSYQSRRLSQMGVPVDVQNSAPIVDSATQSTRDVLRTGGTGQYQNLGTYGGNGNIYGKADDPSRPGRINNFVGVGSGASPANEASGSGSGGASSALQSALRGLGSGSSAPGGPASNGSGPSMSVIGGEDRYDKLAKELRGMYSAKGQGNLAKKLVELEQLRANEQSNIRSNDTSRANAQLGADTSRSNAELGARTNMLEALSRMEQNRASISASAQAAQLKYLQDAQKTAREGEEKGFDRYTGAIGQMFTVTDKDGKQTVDKAAQERFRSFVEGSDPQAGQKFAAMSPQQQQVLLQNFKTMHDMNEVRNKTAQSGSIPSNTGGVTNRMDMPTDVREATWNDYWNNNLPLKDYVWSNLPFTNKNVVQTESGQPVLYSDYTTTDGKKDLDKEKIVRDSVNARRSALRSN